MTKKTLAVAAGLRAGIEADKSEMLRRNIELKWLLGENLLTRRQMTQQ